MGEVVVGGGEGGGGVKGIGSAIAAYCVMVSALPVKMRVSRHIRIAMITVSLAVPVLAFVACNDGQSAPALTSTPEYLTEEISPCTPVPNSSADPCDPDAPRIELCIECYMDLGDEPEGVHEAFVSDVSTPAWTPHLVLRGTYIPDTFRCTADEPFLPPAYLQDEIGGPEAYPATTKCYIDVRVNNYVIGTGPPALTILAFHWHHGSEEHAEEMSRQLELDEGAADVFSGREHLMFLSPPFDLSTLAWWSRHWDVQRREDNTVVAVHPARDHWQRRKPDGYQTYRSVLEMSLPAFSQAVTEAHQARMTEYEGRIGADKSLPMLVTDANQLRDYYTEVGAYAPGVPTPAPPPTISPR